MRPLRYLKLWLILGWGMVLLMVVMSLIPSPDDFVPFRINDKFNHDNRNDSIA